MAFKDRALAAYKERYDAEQAELRRQQAEERRKRDERWALTVSHIKNWVGEHFGFEYVNGLTIERQLDHNDDTAVVTTEDGVKLAFGVGYTVFGDGRISKAHPPKILCRVLKRDNTWCAEPVSDLAEVGRYL